MKKSTLTRPQLEARDLRRVAWHYGIEAQSFLTKSPESVDPQECHLWTGYTRKRVAASALKRRRIGIAGEIAVAFERNNQDKEGTAFEVLDSYACCPDDWSPTDYASAEGFTIHDAQAVISLLTKKRAQLLAYAEVLMLRDGGRVVSAS